MPYIDLYYSIAVYTVTIHSIVLYSSTRYNQLLLCVIFLFSQHAQWRMSCMVYIIYVKKKYYAQLCFEFVSKGKGKGSSAHIWSETRGSLCWSLLFLRLHSRFSPIQERSPKVQGNGMKPLGHPFNCPAIAGNHSIKILSIT